MKRKQEKNTILEEKKAKKAEEEKLKKVAQEMMDELEQEMAKDEGSQEKEVASPSPLRLPSSSRRKSRANVA